MVVRLVAIPACLIVFLSLVGIYGVTAFAVAQRRHEIGVRSALGAQPREIVGLLCLALRWPLLAGLTFGILLSAVSNRLLQQANLVTDVTLADPWAYGSALLPDHMRCWGDPDTGPAWRARRALAGAQR